MEFIPPIARDRPSIAEHGRERSWPAPGERLIELASWMMVLGAIRLAGTLAGYVGGILEVWRSQPITIELLSRFARDNQLLIELCAAWPLILSMALRRKRWLELLPAAAMTFLILSIAGLVELSAEWNHADGSGLTIGSFHLTRRAFIHPTLADVSLGALGATQLLLELITAVRALLLVPRLRESRTDESDKIERRRRARFGRLAIYASLGYLVLMIRLPVWSTYLELLNNSPLVREFVLRNDIKRTRATRNIIQLSKEEQQQRDIQAMVSAAHSAARMDQFQTAKEHYTGLITLVESIPERSWPKGYRSTLAEILNGLAWLEATCPETGYRDPEEAVRHARRAVELRPDDRNIWNTLGVAYYRTGAWKEANDALARSMQLNNGGDSFDWFFLALVELKLGHREKALEWYDRAVEWFRGFQPEDRELYRFQVEAARELGLPKPASSPPPASARKSAGTIFPLGSPSLPRRLRLRIPDPALRPPTQ
jgi:tetratricopeptide (TPR) repeat protein